jgi:hypothetical protein
MEIDVTEQFKVEELIRAAAHDQIIIPIDHRGRYYNEKLRDFTHVPFETTIHFESSVIHINMKKEHLWILPCKNTTAA